MASAYLTPSSLSEHSAGSPASRVCWPGLSLAVIGHAALLSVLLTWNPDLDLPPPEPVLMASLVVPEIAEAPAPTKIETPPPKPVPPPRVEPPPPARTIAVADVRPNPPMVVSPPPPPPVVQAPAPEPLPVEPPRPAPLPEPVKTVAPAPQPAVPQPVAAPPVAQAAPQPAPLPMENDEMKRYLATLMRQLARYKTYPVSLKKAKIEGRVVLEFSIDARGRLVASGIRKGSGSPELDQAALNMLARANPLPAIPAFLKRDQLELAIPVEYSLITDR